MHPLDNPVFHALHSRQTQWAEANALACRFFPAVTTLGGLASPMPDAFAALAALQQPSEATGVVLTEAAEPPAGWTTLASLPLPQYLHAGPPPPLPAFAFEELGDSDSTEMQALAQLTKPGPFGSRTHELGTYLGVRRNGRLLAMAGERVKLPGFTEVSAVCTHPDAAGQGLAAGLVSALLARIATRGEVAFLHVRPDNARAIALYERLGFIERRRLHMLVVRKPSTPPATPSHPPAASGSS